MTKQLTSTVAAFFYRERTDMSRLRVRTDGAHATNAFVSLMNRIGFTKGKSSLRSLIFCTIASQRLLTRIFIDRYRICIYQSRYISVYQLKYNQLKNQNIIKSLNYIIIKDSITDESVPISWNMYCNPTRCYSKRRRQRLRELET